MASVLTAGEITAYRKKGHWKKYFLAVPEYHVIFTAELAAEPSSSDMVTQIEYVNETYPNPDCLDYSALSDVREGMTLYVGSSAGAYDLGMARIRKTPVHPYLYIGETSEIDWELGTCVLDTIYLTVVDDYQLWAKPIKMLNDVAYMDVDIAVGTNHTTFDPVPVMGGHKIAVLDKATGLASVLLGPDADTEAWVLGSTIASVLWECPGSDSVDNLAIVNPTATYSAAGTYPVYCTFTSTTGKTAWGVRYVIVYDSTNRPIIDFSFQSKTVTYDAGGWSFDATVKSDATKADIRDHSLCILFSENYIDGELVQRAEPFPAYQSVETAGYIARYSATRNWEKGNVTFTVEGAQGFLKKMQGFPSGLEFKIGTPAVWTDMPLLTPTRMIWHFLHWRTTATKVMDVILPPDTLYATAFNSMQKFLWDQITEISNSTLFAMPGVDCYGRFFLEVEPQMVPEASRTWPVVMTFVKGDMHGDINWDVETEAQVGILMSASLYVNSSKAVRTYFSLSPGHVPKHYGGDLTIMTNVPLASSQATANSICGLYTGWKNNPYKRFEVSLRSNFKAIDLWPRQFFGLTIESTDDPRGDGYNGNVIPREINFEDDRDTGFEYPIINFEGESFEQLSVNGDIPINTTTSIEFPSFPNFDPNFDVPYVPLIPPVVLPLPDVPLADYKHCLVFDTNRGFLYTENFDEAEPTWSLENGDIDDEDVGNIKKMFVLNGEVFAADTLGVWYAPNPRETYTRLIDAAWMENEYSDYGVGAWGIDSMGINKASNEIGVVFQCDTLCRMAVGDHTGFTALPVAPGTGWNRLGMAFALSTSSLWSLTYGAGLWSYIYLTIGLTSNHLMSIRPDGTIVEQDGNPQSSGINLGGVGGVHQVRLGSSATVSYLKTSDLYITTDNYVVRTLINADLAASIRFGRDLTGQYLMRTDNACVYKSSDFGYTWGFECASCVEEEALILPSDFPVWVSEVFCIDKDRWIVIGKTTNNGVTGNVIIYTPDFGQTWVSKVGNLATMYPDSTFPNMAFGLIEAWP